MLMVIVVLTTMVLLPVSQICWAIHVHLKFLDYSRRFNAARVKWEEAFEEWKRAASLNDRYSMRVEYKNEVKYADIERHAMRAMEAAHNEMIIVPWRWPARWRADYWKETEN